jgi:hypothetical protein
MANKSSIHLMRQFKQRVGNIGARIYGVVLNGIKANSTEYYYYGSGYYKYYSQAHDDESTPMLEDQVKADTNEQDRRYENTGKDILFFPFTFPAVSFAEAKYRRVSADH